MSSNEGTRSAAPGAHKRAQTSTDPFLREKRLADSSSEYRLTQAVVLAQLETAARAPLHSPDLCAMGKKLKTALPQLRFTTRADVCRFNKMLHDAPAAMEPGIADHVWSVLGYNEFGS